MKTVSDEYKSSISGFLRNPSLIRIFFENIDTSAAADGGWQNNGSIYYSDTSTLDYEFDYGDQYATLELNQWSLGGTHDVAPLSNSAHQGYVSTVMATLSGQFVDKPIITRTFGEDHILPGLSITFDTRLGVWPRKITVTFYLNDAVVDEQVIENISETTVTLSTYGGAIDKIVITMDQTLPYHHARVERVLYGVVKEFDNEVLKDSDQDHDVDPLSRRLPSENFTFTIIDNKRLYDPDNPQGVYAYVDIHSPISIQHGYTLDNGNVEWLKADRYVLDSKPKVANDLATFQGTGLLGSMAGTYYKGTFGNKSFYDMATSVLVDAGLPPSNKGENPWVIDDTLKDMYCNIPLKIESHVNCLQQIAHACRCRLFTDDDNIIHLERFNIGDLVNTPVMSLDFNSFKDQSPTITKIDKLYGVSVALYSYSVGTDTTNLYTGTTTDTVLHVEFSQMAQNINIAVTGGTVLSSQIYAQAVDLVMSAGTKTIVITGSSVTESSSAALTVVNDNGAIDVEENRLITNESMRSALADHVAAYLILRNTYDVDYRGNPEIETGDLIGFQTKYTNNLSVLILTDSINFNGAVSGKLKVKGIV